jgi:hypothetical protein
VEAGHFVRSALLVRHYWRVDVWHVSTGTRCMCAPISPQTRMGVADQMIHRSAELPPALDSLVSVPLSSLATRCKFMDEIGIWGEALLDCLADVTRAVTPAGYTFV